MQAHDEWVGAGQACPRIAAWLDRPRTIHPTGDLADSKQAVCWLVERCQQAQRNLFWIDCGDVACVRSVARWSQQVGGTIHVGHSTGGLAARRVLINEGWLGSTLPELAAHADLVITLGDGWRSESPKLAERFLSSQSQEALPTAWWHITTRSDEASTSRALHNIQAEAKSRRPDQVLVWPRDRWLESLTRLLRELQTMETKQSVSLGVTLAQRMVQASNIVFVWQNSDLTSELDELIVSRLHAVARLLSRDRRCSLLNLESNIGRLTAEETLLWLTGCVGTAEWNGINWEQVPGHRFHLLHDWLREFDNIVLIRGTASLDPPPNLDVDVVLGPIEEMQLYGKSLKQYIPIELAGIAEVGYFFRGDRGAVLPAGALEHASEQATYHATAAGLFAMASELLDRSYLVKVGQVNASEATGSPAHDS